MVVGTNRQTWGCLISPWFISEIETDFEASLLGIVDTMPECPSRCQKFDAGQVGILSLHGIIEKDTGIRLLQKVYAILVRVCLNRSAQSPVALIAIASPGGFAVLTPDTRYRVRRCEVEWMIGHHLGFALTFDDMFQVMTMRVLPDKRIPMSVRHYIMAGEHHMILFVEP
jgi:hypothetical protein